MNHRLLLLALLALFTGCDDGASSDDSDTLLSDAQPSDAAVEDAAPIDAEPPPPGVDPAACRIPWNGGTGVGVGFPTPAIRMPSVGVVRATVLFVDFPDGAAMRTPEQVFDMLSPGAEAFFAANAYDQMTLVLEPHLAWLRLSQDAPHYAAGLRSFEEHRAFIEEAVRLADPMVDFSATDVIVVMAAPSVAAIPYGPTWTGVEGWEIEADGNAMTNGITSGADLLDWGSAWLNHELGHSMGLPDLYDYNGPDGFTRPFSLMDLIDDVAPELLAWERWQIGWLSDDQIVCDPSGEVALTPIETAGGLKAAIVPVSPTRAIVVESRRARGYDVDLETEGAVVTVVDGTIASGEGPIRAVTTTPLQAGERTTVDDVTIDVVRSSLDEDVIRVTR